MSVAIRLSVVKRAKLRLLSRFARLCSKRKEGGPFVGDRGTTVLRITTFHLGLGLASVFHRVFGLDSVLLRGMCLPENLG